MLSPESNAECIVQLQQHMALYGYQVVDLPIIQTADLFLIKAGDQIMSRLLTFERHGRQLALRPEFTAIAAQRYLEECGDNTHLIRRWQFSGLIFEDTNSEKTDKDSQRLSMGAELIGMSGPLADAEIVGMAVRGLDVLGINDSQLVIGHMNLLKQILRRFALDARTERFILHQIGTLSGSPTDKSRIAERLDHLLVRQRQDVYELTAETGASAETSTGQMLGDLLNSTQRSATMGGRTQQDIARRLLQKRQRAAERDRISAALDCLGSWVSISAAPRTAFERMSRLATPEDVHVRTTLAEWQAVIAALEVYGVHADRITIRPDLARNWDYYTGIIFEITDKEGISLGGGGRYDELARLIGAASDVPAVGFAYNMNPIIGKIGSPPQSAAPISLMFSSEETSSALIWAAKLREHHQPCVLIPAGQAAGDAVTFNVHNDTIQSGDRNYTLADIQKLIQELRYNS